MLTTKHECATLLTFSGAAFGFTYPIIVGEGYFSIDTPRSVSTGNIYCESQINVIWTCYKQGSAENKIKNIAKVFNLNVIKKQAKYK